MTLPGKHSHRGIVSSLNLPGGSKPLKTDTNHLSAPHVHLDKHLKHFWRLDSSRDTYDQGAEIIHEIRKICLTRATSDKDDSLGLSIQSIRFAPSEKIKPMILAFP